MAKKSIDEIEASAELITAARIAYANPFSSFWEELTERLYPKGGATVEPLPRREDSGTV